VQDGSGPSPSPEQLAATVEVLQGLLAQLQPMLKAAGEYLTVDEAAAEMKASRDTVVRLVESGKLPALDLATGKHHAYRIKRSDLEALRLPARTRSPRFSRRRTSAPAYPRLA
jgi:excisionase family DNA binding protein